MPFCCILLHRAASMSASYMKTWEFLNIAFMATVICYQLMFLCGFALLFVLVTAFIWLLLSVSLVAVQSVLTQAASWSCVSSCASPCWASSSFRTTCLRLAYRECSTACWKHSNTCWLLIRSSVRSPPDAVLDVDPSSGHVQYWYPNPPPDANQYWVRVQCPTCPGTGLVLVCG